MPRRSACTYARCKLGLIPPGKAVTKDQKNHVSTYHRDYPIQFLCSHTDRKAIFHRQKAKNMDFVCFCGQTFTLNSSLPRHYKICKVARDAALQGLSSSPISVKLENEHSPGVDNGDSALPSAAPKAESNVESVLKERMIELHLALLKAVVEHTITQASEFVTFSTRNNMLFQQASAVVPTEQNAEIQDTIADRYREAMEKQQALLDCQRRNLEQKMAEQSRRYRAAIETGLFANHEGSLPL